MNRSAPIGGYEFGAKRHYRRNVWATIRRICQRLAIPRGSAHALLMPSIEGTEIEVAMQAGFKEQHLHVVDRNPAIVAHLKRRFPKINAYGVELETACSRLAKKGVDLRVANLDFCSYVNRDVIAAVEAARACIGRANKGCVAVNVLRGRERDVPMWKGFAQSFDRPEWFAAGPAREAARLMRERMPDGLVDRSRLIRIAAALISRAPDKCSDPLLERSGIYRSAAGGQTMLWSVWTVNEAVLL